MARGAGEHGDVEGVPRGGDRDGYYQGRQVRLHGHQNNYWTCFLVIAVPLATVSTIPILIGEK